MALKLSNNATSKLASTIAAGSTTLSVIEVDADKFPALGEGDWFPATLVKPNGSFEIVKVTARAGAVFTIQRAQEGTIALEFAAASVIQLRLTAGTLVGQLEAIEEKVEDIEEAQLTAADLSGAPAETSMLDADRLNFFDTAAGIFKRITLANFKTLLTAVFVQRLHQILTTIALVRNPAGAALQGGASETGAIKITLPVAWSGNMIVMRVMLYVNQTGATLEFTLAGLLDAAGQWKNTTAFSFGEHEFGSDFTVRFGDDGGNPCIWIGETATTWAYPALWVPEVFVGAAAAATAWNSGWAVAFDNAFGTVDTTHIGTRVGKAPTKSTDAPSGGIDGDVWLKYTA